MKKDIEWLKNRLTNTLKFEAQNDREIGFKVAMEEVIELIDQLDEPEVLSQEWIDRNKEPFHHFETKKVDYYVSTDFLQNLLVPKQEEITHKQVEKYLLDKNIRVIDIDIYEEMQSELEELKNGATLSKTETVADVITNFWKSLERLKEVMSMEVEELEE